MRLAVCNAGHSTALAEAAHLMKDNRRRWAAVCGPGREATGVLCDVRTLTVLGRPRKRRHGRIRLLPGGNRLPGEARESPRCPLVLAMLPGVHVLNSDILLR